MDAISTSHVTKTYRMGVGRARVREMLPWPIDHVASRAFPGWWARDAFDALHDVSFSVPAGSSVGIVGHNGAGKTTLLKVISGVTSPTTGRVEVSGSVAALLDLLVAFIPDLTGRENLYYLASIHGVGRRTMGRRVQHVIDFAGIADDLLDTPVKRYSTGMMARLGFATITALDAAILLIDEVLAVGDGAFQRQCTRWLEEYKRSGGTLLFVSHNLSLVRNMTDRVVWLHHGRMIGDGPAASIIPEYVRALELRDSEAARFMPGRGGSKLIQARGLYRWGAGGASVEQVHVGDPSPDDESLDVDIAYDTSELERAVFCIGFIDEAGNEVGGTASPVVPLRTGKGNVRCTIDLVHLRPGSYFPVVAILSEDGVVRDRWRLDRAFVVEGNGQPDFTDEFGPVRIGADWSSVRND